ncbi:MFS transporter [Novosphingobium lentum]|uniref:MFS transporter n=1 Tax=Novosphingobium lentum TaxID=145287 RepID=UPI00082E120C|nr:MFS transporter [Novosphingobium lentum]
MAASGQSTIRKVYAHVALQSFAENSGGLFVNAFLVRQGVPVPLALASFALLLLSRFALRGAVLPLAKRMGLRNVLALGVAVRTVGYLLLPSVTGIGPMLGFYLFVSGLGSVLYWTSYHAFVSAVGDSAARGRQVSIQQAATAIVAIVAPITGGLLLVSAGPRIGFVVVALVQAAAALPLLTAPNPAVVRDVAPAAPSAVVLTRFARRLYFAEGLHAGCAGVVWNMALFVSLGERFEAFGGAMALAGLVAAAGSLLIGRLIDSGEGRRTLVLAYGAAALAIAIKALAFASPMAAVGATALGALVTPMAATALLSPLYGMAQRSACVLRFAMATEGGWDLGCAGACLIAAAALQLGAGFRLPILLGLAAVSAITLMLRHWYAQAAAQPGLAEPA